MNIDHKVSTTAVYSKAYASISSGGQFSRNTVMAIIWKAVLYFPTVETATLVRAPNSAIHSRKAETVISREIITIAAKAIDMEGCHCTSTISAAATINLSATGSRNRPKAEVWFNVRAR